MAIAFHHGKSPLESAPVESPVARFPIIAALPERVRMAVEDRAVVRKYTRNTPVFWQGDKLRNLPLVVDGHLKLMRNTEGGREVVVDVVGPGETPCWPETLTDSSAQFTLVALEDVRIAQLPITPLRHCISSDPRSAVAWANHMSRQQRALLHQVASTRAPSVPARLGGLLLHLLHRYGDTRAGIVPIRLTRQDLADATGTTVETAIRLMRKWEKAGVVETRRDSIRVLDFTRLQLAADGADI